MIQDRAAGAELPGSVQALHHCGQRPLLPLVPHDALPVGAHQEESLVADPLTVVGDAVGLAIDDVDGRFAQLQPMDEPHGRGQRIELRGDRLNPRRAAAVDTPSGSHLLADRCDRGAVAVAEDQGCEQFIAEVGGATQDGTIALALVGLEEELGPVVDDQGIVPVVLLDGCTCNLDQGLGQLRERDAEVGVEAPGGLGAGERLSGPGQGAEPGGDGLNGREMFLDQLEITPLQTRVVGRQR